MSLKCMLIMEIDVLELVEDGDDKEGTGTLRDVQSGEGSRSCWLSAHRERSQARLAFATNEHKASFGWVRAKVDEWSVGVLCISLVVIAVDLH